MPLFVFFLNVLVLPFRKAKSQIDQLQKDSLGKSYEIILVSEIAIFAQKWLKIAAQKKGNCLVFATHC